jgi:hypothetical protein
MEVFAFILGMAMAIAGFVIIVISISEGGR